MTVVLDDDVYLTRKELAEASKKIGFPITEATLCTFASRGVGPEYRKFNNYVRYRWGDYVAWAQQKSTYASSAKKHKVKSDD